ncbi:MAG: hypothetical protein AAF960_22065 [Bacteroidota bacterium]
MENLYQAAFDSSIFLFFLSMKLMNSGKSPLSLTALISIIFCAPLEDHHMPFKADYYNAVTMIRTELRDT